MHSFWSLTRIFIYRPQPLGANSGQLFNGNEDDDHLGGFKNRFQFLNQNLNLDISPIRGSGQSGDDYSYSQNGYNNNDDENVHGYNYKVPLDQLQTHPVPSRQYLPVH
ncbi:uncharacterized protein LOC119669030 [Teleopsis dalmanni]|uniref:uncharacterized protein LOC119669030 n=1 Tax=Teleopsis dalmanni TaxID=139649 RepID=UPI0018CD20F9|nr:uncharacterized protein LOC119669030 [Teleopsis dalmanni]